MIRRPHLTRKAKCAESTSSRSGWRISSSWRASTSCHSGVASGRGPRTAPRFCPGASGPQGSRVLSHIPRPSGSVGEPACLGSAAGTPETVEATVDREGRRPPTRRVVRELGAVETVARRPGALEPHDVRRVEGAPRGQRPRGEVAPVVRLRLRQSPQQVVRVLDVARAEAVVLHVLTKRGRTFEAVPAGARGELGHDVGRAAADRRDRFGIRGRPRDRRSARDSGRPWETFTSTARRNAMVVPRVLLPIRRSVRRIGGHAQDDLDRLDQPRKLNRT